VYEAMEPYSCKSCGERFDVKMTIRGISPEKYDRYIENDQRNLEQSGGMNFRPSYSVAQEQKELFYGLCSSCLAEAANRFLKNETTTTTNGKK
jgi:hypothetical protein